MFGAGPGTFAVKVAVRISQKTDDKWNDLILAIMMIIKVHTDRVLPPRRNLR